MRVGDWVAYTRFLAAVALGGWNTCPPPEPGHEEFSECLPVGNNLYNGAVSFDNIFASFLAVFQVRILVAERNPGHESLDLLFLHVSVGSLEIIVHRRCFRSSPTKVGPRLCTQSKMVTPFGCGPSSSF